MKCYRVYVNNECVGTFFSHMQAVMNVNMWFSAGYTADEVDVKTEDY